MRISTSTLAFCPRSCTLPPTATQIFQPRPFRDAQSALQASLSPRSPFTYPSPMPIPQFSRAVHLERDLCRILSLLPADSPQYPDHAACQTQLSILSWSQHLAPGPCSAFCAGTGNWLSIPSLDRGPVSSLLHSLSIPFPEQGPCSASHPGVETLSPSTFGSAPLPRVRTPRLS